MTPLLVEDRYNPTRFSVLIEVDVVEEVGIVVRPSGEIVAVSLNSLFVRNQITGNWRPDQILTIAGHYNREDT